MCSIISYLLNRIIENQVIKSYGNNWGLKKFQTLFYIYKMIPEKRLALTRKGGFWIFKIWREGFIRISS